jgi:hypothetical protein
MDQNETALANRRFSVRRCPGPRVRAGFRASGGPDTLDLALALLNVSQAGARFLLRSEVKPKWQMEVTFRAPKQLRPFRVLGRVVWCTPMADSSGYDVGITFRQPLALGLLGMIAPELSDEHFA